MATGMNAEVLRAADWAACLAKTNTQAGCYVIDAYDGFTYPHDYVRSLTERLRRHDNRVVAGARGLLCNAGPDALHLGGQGLHRPVLVTALGAGTLAFHSRSIPPQTWTEATGPCGTALRQAGLTPLLCIDQPQGWLTGCAPVGRTSTAHPAPLPHLAQGDPVLALQPLFHAELDLCAISGRKPTGPVSCSTPAKHPAPHRARPFRADGLIS
jgi:hypothetical protein